MVSPGHGHSSLWCIHEEKVVLRRNEWNQKPENVQTSWTLETMTYFSHSLRGVWPGNLAHLVSISVSSVLLWPPSMCHRAANLERACECGVMGAAPNHVTRGHFWVFLCSTGLPRTVGCGLERKLLCPLFTGSNPREGRVSMHSLWLPSDLAALLQTITQPRGP